MILQQGLPLLYQHFTALFKKNLLLSWRNKRSTCLQLFSSFFFILVIFCIEEAMKASEASSSAYKNVTDPTLLFSLPILPCEDKFFVKLPCYDFVWSGNNSRRVIDIVSAIMANNPGRPIPTNKVQSFKAPEEVDAWFMSHALQVPGVLHFVERNATTFKFLVPLQIAAEREIARSLMGDPKFGWDFGFKEFARPAIIAEVISALKIVSATGFPYSNAYPASRRAIWSLFPPNTFSAGLKLLLDATSTPASSGISWSERAVCEGGMSTCVLSIDIIYQWQVGTFLFWFVLAIYFDNIIPNASGVRKPIFYFLTPGYWTGKGGNKVEEGSIFSCIGSVPPVEHVAPEDQDVLEEETLVKQQAMDGIVDPNIAVPIHGLAETYPGTTKLGWFVDEYNQRPVVLSAWTQWCREDNFYQLFDWHKSNYWWGALIYGDSVRSSVGMSNIRKMIGVCPQFYILWDALSSEEHLHLFASIKGLPPASINSTAEKLLADVKLTGAAKVRAGSYSCGMKRRLSVAVALIGDPSWSS
ncbi:unnamed protein product [Brassica napus]|uniref:(rape) hypothetical protein n=1 Tax=Brassica napus TaxID=3708 RepID=A0A816Y4I4_BRANA|nr:unnamed protein product [Brassica napus]